MTAQRRRQRKASRRASKAQLLALAGTDDQGADLNQWSDTIRRHPWSALGIGVAVGVVLGMSPKLRNGVLLSVLHLTK